MIIITTIIININIIMLLLLLLSSLQSLYLHLHLHFRFIHKDGNVKAVLQLTPMICPAALTAMSRIVDNGQACTASLQTLVLMCTLMYPILYFLNVGSQGRFRQSFPC